jgi:hypothetical protein
MPPVIAVPALDDFRPPYHLGAFGCAVFGVWDAAAAPPSEDLGGFEPVRWRGRNVGTALVLRYDRPAESYPVAYSEIIFAHLVRRGARLAAMPFDLVLDNQFYVDAGRHHYHLPKRFDATLRIEVERDAAGAPKRLLASGKDVAFEAALGAIAVPCAAGVASLLLRGFTNHASIIGVAARPLLEATIAVAPDSATAFGARRAGVSVQGRTLRPLGAMFWETLQITVGVPAPVAI